MSAIPNKGSSTQAGFLARGMSRFGYRKNVDQLLAEAHDKQGLAKTLTASNLVMLGVAGIIGGGIFVLVGSGIIKAGALVVPAFIVAALICTVAGLAYAELASAIPASGSAYAYIYTAMGELPGWMVAWALILEYAVGAIAVAVACRNNLLAVIKQVTWIFNPADAAAHKDYFTDPSNPSLFGWTHSPLEAVRVTNLDGSSTYLHGIINIPSIIIVLLVTMLLVKGTKESARFTSVLVVLKVAILLFAIGTALFYFDSSNFADPLPHPTPDAPNIPDVRQFGQAVLAAFGAAAIMFFAYIGFDSVSTTAEETKNPKKDLPIGILGSLGISTLLYILAAGALVGASHWTTFVGDSAAAKAAAGEPFGYVFEQHGALSITLSNGSHFSLGALLVRLGAMIGTTSVLLVLILGGVRVFFNMSRDGLLPGWMSKVGPRGNPAKTTWFYGAFTLFFAGLLTLDAAVELVNIGTLFAFFMVVLAVWMFRRRRPDVERPFRMPLWSVMNRNGKPVLPILTILGLLGIMALIFSLDPFTLVASAAWAGLGLLVYAFYGIRHSKEAHHRHVMANQELPDPFAVGRPAGTTEEAPRKK
ncbi:MAG: amino acid permease [bacterium]